MNSIAQFALRPQAAPPIYPMKIQTEALPNDTTPASRKVKTAIVV
jgi:hypothetical protein